MRKTTTLLVLMLFLCSFAACRKEHTQPGTPQQTQTIAPAAAKPDQSGTSDVMTQTVEVDDSRSEGEGGTAAGTAPTTTSAPAKPAPAKPAPSKHKKH